jgi:hypothetical protein
MIMVSAIDIMNTAREGVQSRDNAAILVEELAAAAARLQYLFLDRSHPSLRPHNNATDCAFASDNSTATAPSFLTIQPVIRSIRAAFVATGTLAGPVDG